MLGVAAKTAPFILVVAFDFNGGHDHGQHLLMNVNSRYAISHTVPPGGSGERAASYIKQGRGLSPLPTGGETTPIYSLNHARSGSDSSTASTSPLLGTISPLRTLSYSP